MCATWTLGFCPMEASVAEARGVPAPGEGAGERADTMTQQVTEPYRPWAMPEISELPLACENAAHRAVEFAETVFDLDREAEGLDWASRVQARCDAPWQRLARCLPPGMADAVRGRAERMLAHA